MKISMAVIDKRVSEVLRVKFRLRTVRPTLCADTKAADRVGGQTGIWICEADAATGTLCF